MALEALPFVFGRQSHGRILVVHSAENGDVTS